jgi:hypothetical protein
MARSASQSAAVVASSESTVQEPVVVQTATARHAKDTVGLWIPPTSAPNPPAPAAAPVQQVACIIVLPCQRGLPVGHVLIGAFKGEDLVGCRQYECKTEDEVNAQVMKAIATAQANGYVAELHIACRVHYRTTINQWKRDPLSTIKYVREWKPQAQQAEQNSDMPF